MRGEIDCRASNLHSVPPMKAYLIVTGILFALLAVAHVVQAIEVMNRLSSDPTYVLGVFAIAITTVSLTIWALVLVRRQGRTGA